MADGTKWELTWKRPENVPYPQVWCTFEAISKKTGSKYKIKIQDIPVDRFEESVEFMQNNLHRNEPLCRASELWTDAESVTSFNTIKRKLLAQKVSLMAVIDDDNNANSKSEIVGILLLSVKSKKDPPTKQSGSKLNKIFGFLDYATSGFDPFQLLETNEFIYHLGVAVLPKYFGLGIGLKLESQSSVVGKACGIKGSAIVFTSKYSQPFFEKLGCTFINEVHSDNYIDENGKAIMPNFNGSLIFVIWKYPSN